MKKNRLLLPLFCALLLLSSCGMNVLRGEGKKIVEPRTVPSFDALDISVSTDVKVTMSEGAAPGVELSGYANIIKHLKTEVKGTTLHVSFDLDDTWTVNDDDLAINITLPTLKALTLAGAPDAVIHGNLKGSEFKLDVSGASNIVIDNLNVDNFMADMSGKSDLEIKGGVVKTASYEVSGIGKIEAYALQTEETNASISGAAEGEVNASKKLDASISGAGSITYKGRPEVTKHVSGAGSVSAAD